MRQQLYDLKNQDRDYKGVNDDIINTENRYKMLADDKVSDCCMLNMFHRYDLRWSLELDLTEIWTKLLISESKSMT